MYSEIDRLLNILEKNGKITVIPKARANIPTCEQSQIRVKEKGIFHIVIDNGTVNAHGLYEVRLTRDQLERRLKKKGFCVRDVYLMMIGDDGEERIISKREAQ